jgi:hypothetical protein
MLESVIMLLIYLCILALVIYLVLWVLESLGLALPPMVVKIIWIIAVLIAILLIVRILLPAAHLGRIGEAAPFLGAFV